MALFVGLDVSQASTHISVVDSDGKERWHGKVHTSPEALACAVDIHAAGAAKIGMESGPLSPWLYHALKEKGLPVICIDARHAKAGLELQGANKTDRKDAKGLARIMQTGWYREVSVKEIDGHKQQTALMVRRQLVGMRTECINQVRGILKLYGKVLPSGKLPALQTLMLADDLLGKSLGAVYAVLETVSLEIARIDKEIRILARADERCQVLQTIPGIGPITSFAFSCSLGDPERFKKSRTVGAYFGLSPKRKQSGQMDTMGRITKHGDVMVRSYLFEAASNILARTKTFSTLKAWGLRVKKRSGWNKACVAVARKLAVIMHRMVITGECFRFANPQREKGDAHQSAVAAA
jgi:transposase